MTLRTATAESSTRERETCTTCCRDASSPYRRYDERGRVLYGCVDAFHTGHLVTPSESARWHARPDAKKIRAAMKAMRTTRRMVLA